MPQIEQNIDQIEQPFKNNNCSQNVNWGKTFRKQKPRVPIEVHFPLAISDKSKSQIEEKAKNVSAKSGNQILSSQIYKPS